MNIHCPEPCLECKPIPLGGEGIFPNPNSEANPFINFSSEAPDRRIFVGRSDGGGGGGGGDDLPHPPLGPWTEGSCLGLCVSSISQTDADICAANAALFCQVDLDPPDDPAVPGVFGNVAQTCDEKCGGGIVHTGFVPASTFLGPDQASANAAAKQLACLKTACGNDPQQCTVFCSDGSPFTYNVVAGYFYAPTRDQANAIAASFACSQARANQFCLSPLVGPGGSGSRSNCCEGEEFSNTISITSLNQNQEPYTFTVSNGSLPPGLNLFQTGAFEATIFGTPTTLGDYAFGIKVTSAQGASAERGYTIRVKGIESLSPLPDADSGIVYGFQMVPSSNIQGAIITWHITAGSLPPGLSLNTATGEISGTPTDVSETTYTFTISMTDAVITCEKDFSLTVQASSTCPAWDTMLWDVPATGSAGAGTFSGTFLFENFAAMVDSPGGGNDFATIGDNSLPPDYLTYNGPGCNCNLHVEILSIAGGPTEIGGAPVQVFLFPGAILLASFDWSVNPVGSYDVPFVVPDTLGADVHLAVGLTLQSGSDPGIFTASNVSISGTVTNLP